jgi:BNR repeat protein
MERFIAIDNVCAWPNLTRMGDGTTVATIFNQPTHGGWEGDVECWGTADEGRTWTLRGVAAEHEPTTNRMNVAAGMAHDGALVVLASGWSKRNPVGDYSPPQDGEILPTWACRSMDGGVSWEVDTRGIEAPAESQGVIPFGDVVQLPNEELGVCLYSWAPGRCSALFYVSGDGGRTWTIRGVLRDGDANESAPVVLPDGRLLAAVRTNDDGHLELVASEDEGRTWSERGVLTLPGQHPGHLLVLHDGRVLLCFGIRNKGLHGVGVRLSDDLGDTWQGLELLVDIGMPADCGYPASVQEPDGTVITTYYTNGIPTHQRYHMGVARWRPDEA